MTKLCATLCFSLLPIINDWYVNIGDPNCINGTGGPTDPFCQIAEAVNAASDGDTIHIEPGTYFENLTLNKSLTFIGTQGQAVTVLNGSNLGTVVHVDSGATVNFSHVTVTNGSAVDHGGGIHVKSDSCPTLTNCSVNANRTAASPGAFYYGGGVYGAPGSSLTLNETQIFDNRGGCGGGISSHGDLAMDRCTVTDNHTTVILSYGGGLDLRGTSTIANSTIAYNGTSSSYEVCGGGICNLGDLFLTNSLVNENASFSLGGGGISNLAGASATLLNCTITENHGDIEGGGLNAGFGGFNLQNCVVAENTAFQDNGPDCFGTIESLGHNLIGDTNDCVIDGDETGNLYNLDPLFLDPANDDYRLQSASPAVDAGDPSAVPTGSDLAGNPRSLDGDLDRTMIVDMGAYEFNNVHFEITGESMIGGTITLETTGTAGLVAFLFLGTEPGEAMLPPYGTLFFDLSAPWDFQRTPFAIVPDSFDFTIDPDFPTNTTLYLQELAVEFFSGNGNFSNVVELMVGS